METIILAGGLGTRLAEETTVRPKPLVEIGGRPILWHILNIYAAQGFRDFIIASGYKGEQIKEYFANYRMQTCDVIVDMASGKVDLSNSKTPDWRVAIIDTGIETQTGGRTRRCEPWVGQSTFMLTYGDGVGDINIRELVAFHRSHGKLATITAVRPPARFGGVVMEGDQVMRFTEKPQAGEGWINGGFMVLEPQVFSYIDGDATILERGPLERLAADGQLMAYRHEGFWQPMDTLREKQLLENLWREGEGSMEDLVANLRGFFRGKRVLLTGHTGFKGAWLAIWLADLGAEVHGYALDAPTQPNLYEEAKVRELLASDTRGDVRDLQQVSATMDQVAPQIVLHLAAQSLVRRSYRQPSQTFATNLMGTVNVMEAARHCTQMQVCQIITTDKCYENREWVHPYREEDRVGGHDPYSASKACAELAVASYRRALLSEPGGRISLASARAGNVIGGGDWAEDRIVPDAVRALEAGKPIPVRNPHAVRPWQHVLEPLSGYLALAYCQWHRPDVASQAFNFGPLLDANLRVEELVRQVVRTWGSGGYEAAAAAGRNPHEANVLKLDITKAGALLGWSPRWNVAEAVGQTVAWYRKRHVERGFDARSACLEQIRLYEQARPLLATRLTHATSS